jgi:hypothetical protein
MPNNMQRVINIISKPQLVFMLFSILVIAATAQSILLTKPTGYTQYNNYIIFKQSFFHLTHGQDLYAPHYDECWDLFKYSPAFALFFGAFAYLPDWLGLFLWNGLNAFVLLFAIYKLPYIKLKQKSFMLLFAAIELMTSLQNSQSNGLITGLLILAFCMLEKENILLATLFISFTVFIKLFGIVACILFLFYRKNWLKIALYMILWCSLLAFIPVFFCGFEQLVFLYKSWLHLLQNDHSISVGYSVLGFIQTWLKTEPNKTLVLLIGGILLLIPLLKTKSYQQYSFRISMLAFVLIWIIIFNHKAESPTFIVAVTGIAIWLFSQENISKTTIALAIAVFIFTCLSPTDIFPASIRKNIFQPYVVKVIPCILVWIKIGYDLLRFQPK